jgi:hypothetical protein
MMFYTIQTMEGDLFIAQKIEGVRDKESKEITHLPFY